MKRVLFNCDDFGKSHEVNAAVLQAHREGVLGSASLMVTGAAFSEAVEIARANPSLKVGLHLVLCNEKPLLRADQVPGLINGNGHLLDPTRIGVKLAFNQKAMGQASAEIKAQFESFMATGLVPSHVDGHHHLHMHPFIFTECIRWAEKFGFHRIRVTREFGDPLPPRRDFKKFLAKCACHFTFTGLSAVCNRSLVKSPLQYLEGVLGLWETGRMDEEYLLYAIPQLPAGDWEVYMHVGSPGSEEELPAMLSPKLKNLLKEQNIECL